MTPTFRFTAGAPGTGYRCRVDGGPFRPCRSPLTLRRLRYGRHVFEVRAVDARGLAEGSPARWVFRVVRR